jgi:hypothetical protein
MSIIVINNHLDKWIKGGLEGNYLFSSELDNLESEGAPPSVIY